MSRVFFVHTDLYSTTGQLVYARGQVLEEADEGHYVTDESVHGKMILWPPDHLLTCCGRAMHAALLRDECPFFILQKREEALEGDDVLLLRLGRNVTLWQMDTEHLLQQLDLPRDALVERMRRQAIRLRNKDVVFYEHPDGHFSLVPYGETQG